MRLFNFLGVFCLSICFLFLTTTATLQQARPLTSRFTFQGLTNGTAFSNDAAFISQLNTRWPDLNLDTSSIVLRVQEGLYFLDRGYDGGSIGSEAIVFSPDGTKIHHHLILNIPGIFSGELVVRFVAADPQPFQVALFGFGDGSVTTPDGITATAANAGVGQVIKAEGQLNRFLNGQARVSGMINQEGPFVAPGVRAFGDIIWVVVQTQ